MAPKQTKWTSIRLPLWDSYLTKPGQHLPLMRPRTIVVLDDSVPWSLLNGAHASLSAREWQPFNATKSQWQPGMSPALGWQSLCFLINLDAMFLLQTFLLFFSPSLPNFLQLPYIEYLLCARHWAGPWGYSGDHDLCTTICSGPPWSGFPAWNAHFPPSC